MDSSFTDYQLARIGLQGNMNSAKKFDLLPCIFHGSAIRLEPELLRKKNAA